MRLFPRKGSDVVAVLTDYRIVSAVILLLAAILRFHDLGAHSL